ncbi:unnamed protein product [Heligmosomoides polygyrus]|uniref:BPTI/Kunitz inhibitor domain-containing protein n=1 Tax=Heligmosomoides polygyrus TaxID=6339 RepID=A0A183FMX7_HELPZ|nr:unnamed protein product [Heligmosomoides polygyrus]
MLLLVAALLSGLALCYSSRSVRNEPGASAGGSVDLCSLPADSGSCSRELIRYYYDPVDDDCKRFTYS